MRGFLNALVRLGLVVGAVVAATGHDGPGETDVEDNIPSRNLPHYRKAAGERFDRYSDKIHTSRDDFIDRTLQHIGRVFDSKQRFNHKAFGRLVNNVDDEKKTLELNQDNKGFNQLDWHSQEQAKRSLRLTHKKQALKVYREREENNRAQQKPDPDSPFQRSDSSSSSSDSDSSDSESDDDFHGRHLGTFMNIKPHRQRPVDPEYKARFH